MNRWFGSAADSEKQAADRNTRAARRTIASLPSLALSSDEEFGDAETSLSNLNLDGQVDNDEEETMDAGQGRRS